MRTRRALRSLALLSVVLGSGQVLAQSTKSATAEDLFQQGTAAMRADDLARGCTLLAESYRLDPAGGTLQNLAVCYENQRKIASAYARFEELKTLSKNASPPRQDRIELAETHLARLRPKLSRAIIEMPTANHGATVQIDEVEYGEPSWASGILLDPGAHALAVRSRQHVAFETNLQITHDHTVLRVRVPVLAPLSAPSAPPPRHAALATAGWITGGIGVAALATGGVFGVLAFTTNSRGEGACPGPQGTCGTAETDRANDLRGQARTYANVSNVLLPIGAVAASVGAIMVWRAHARSAEPVASVHVAPTWSGGVLAGTF